MGWNKRIIAKEYPSGWTYQIHEVFYDENGNIDGWTQDEAGLFGEDLEDLRMSFHQCSIAFLKPILVEKDGKLKELE